MAKPKFHLLSLFFFLNILLCFFHGECSSQLDLEDEPWLNEEDDEVVMVQTHHDSRNRCDFSIGKWVYDQSYPLYDTNCPYLSAAVTCQKNGRPDSDYEKWKWKPQGCSIPRFDALDFLGRMRKKRIMLVGDSIMRNQWESLVCLVQGVIPTARKRVIYNGPTMAFHAMDFEISIEFSWAPLLVELRKGPENKRILHLDLIEENAKYWRGVDILVFVSLCAVAEPLLYPTARRDESVVDDYHGVKVADPYRWLEDPDAEEVKEFVQKQVKLTESVLEKCESREKLREKITKLFDYPRYDAPFRRGDKYFYFHNTGLQAQNVLYVQDSLDGKPEVLLDPNVLSEDGTVSLNMLSVSEDAKYLAYGLSTSGSDWVTIKVMRVDDKKVEADTLSWVKFSCISWTHDGKGFFYSRYPAPKKGDNVDAGTETNSNLYHELYYHLLGTNQSEDILCWRDSENPKYMFEADVTDDGKYVLLYIEEDCDPVNKFYYCDLSVLPNGLEGLKGKNDLLPFIKHIDEFGAQYRVIANDNTEFTFRTNKDAPKYKLVRVDLKEPTVWSDVIQEAENDVLESACAVNGNQMIVRYLSDVKYILQIRDLKSGSFLHQLPIDIGTVYGISARREDNIVFIGFTSFLSPGIIYQCNLEAGVPKLKIFREIDVPGFDRSEFYVDQVFATSKDGTKIPMFIVARKNILLDGSHPCLLYGYGGFNVSLTPSFSVGRIVLTRHLGTVYCIANIRGGGEYGEEWHKAGSLAKKQNCFDDFISAGEYLISAGYTQPKKLCIEGGSNGGLLIGACINQRPDLFGCALAHVGVMDMLRFHKFTIGHAWTSDFGCSDKEEEFHWLIKYSPLHNVRRPWEQHPDQPSQYPPTMLLTADHDDRVVPLHSLKLLATMQYVLCTSLEKSPQVNPIIGRIECKAGHGAGRPTQKLIDEAADRYGFMAKMLDASWID